MILTKLLKAKVSLGKLNEPNLLGFQQDGLRMFLPPLPMSQNE
jgi:hypothetical protein